jgi:FlaA1/EpsC-like NDP-sugar epimerase
MTNPRNRHLLAFDAVLLSLSPFLVYALRFEGLQWGPQHLRTAIVFTLVTAPLRLLIYWAFGLYSRLWRYASIAELELIFLAGVSASAASALVGHSLLTTLNLAAVRVPMSVLFTNGLLAIFITAAPRLLARIGGWRAAERTLREGHLRRTLIAGAGSAGRAIVRELRENPQLGMVPVGFVDDDIAKHGLRLAGLPVFGALSQTAQVMSREDVGELIITMPNARGTVVRDVVRAALDAGVKAHTIPGLADILVGRVSVNALRKVEIQDLLRRDPIHTNLDQVGQLAAGRTVLVTGAGGSIGSELARQIARLSPVTLILLDHAENPIFHVRNELHAEFPGLHIVPVIGDVRDRRRMFSVLEQHRPFTVFHAAAHKHVPLMEENVIEAITNNIKGTQNLVDASAATDVTHFVLISTDKAVRPTSVMGATKRVAEHVVRHAALEHRKNYVAVRFGNVLGSQGSVVPTFMEQIRAGGPVTVTHPEMRRFFMTIPEAVQLVLQAGALGRGGELFMLDMGEQVKIVDLARDLIRLSGLEVDVDIDIQYVGVRPGEKLYEEMFFEHEHATRTDHPKVLRARDQLEHWGMEQVHELIAATMDGADDRALLAMLCQIVPDFTPDGTVAPPPPTLSPSYRDANPNVSDLLRAPRPGSSQNVVLSKKTLSRQPEL